MKVASDIGSKRPLCDGSEGAEERKKRQKSYCPVLGSANYGFMVILYKVGSMN